MTTGGLNQLSNRREQVLFLLVVCVVVVLFFKMFYAPLQEQNEGLKARLEALKLEKDALIKFSQTTPSLEKGVSLTRKKNVKIKVLLGEVRATDQTLTDLLTRLTTPPLSSGVTFQDMSSTAPVIDKGGYEQTDFKLSLRGNFSDLLRYLERLEDFPALFSVESAGFQASEDQLQYVESEVQGHFFRLVPGWQVNQAATSATGKGTVQASAQTGGSK